MRIATHFGRVGIGDRPFDWDDMWTSARGLTGSDGTFIGISRSLRDRGHDVTMFVHKAPHRKWDGIQVCPANALGDQPEFDAVVTVNDVDVLSRVHPRAVRAANQQLADYRYARPGFHKSVDVFLPISEFQWSRLKRVTKPEGCLDAATYRVLPNGCEPERYAPWEGTRVPGRCVHISSPDRGLWTLMLAWPEIVRRVPNAHLRIFYHSLQRWLDETESMATHEDQYQRESARRAGIVRRGLAEHTNSIEIVGSVSRQRMARELCEASAMLYPCQPVVPCETFCVSALEGCASGAIPVISEADCLKEVFESAAPMVPHPVDRHLSLYAELAAKALTDHDWAEGWRARGKAFAARHAWSAIGEKLEAYLLEALERKKAAA